MIEKYTSNHGHTAFFAGPLPKNINTVMEKNFIPVAYDTEKCLVAIGAPNTDTRDLMLWSAIVSTGATAVLGFIIPDYIAASMLLGVAAAGIWLYWRIFPGDFPGVLFERNTGEVAWVTVHAGKQYTVRESHSFQNIMGYVHNRGDAQDVQMSSNLTRDDSDDVQEVLGKGARNPVLGFVPHHQPTSRGPERGKGDGETRLDHYRLEFMLWQPHSKKFRPLPFDSSFCYPDCDHSLPDDQRQLWNFFCEFMDQNKTPLH